MKKNLPITDNEVPFPLGEEIISTTDLKGTITSYNSTFLEISGFEESELMHKNHNVIHHPDMPVEAFADLWGHMKQNKHWMGIVKNRCKNGDHYWVDAYVTPMLENDQVVGYESVRAKPTAERVARAEKVYKQIRDVDKPRLGSFLSRLCLKCRATILNIGAVLAGLGAYLLTPELMMGLPITDYRGSNNRISCICCWNKMGFCSSR